MFKYALLALTIATTSAHSACYDLSKSEPHNLTGVLSHRIFAGPPNFQDVRKGDTPEPGYVLKLAESICLTGDESAETGEVSTEPGEPFSEVQLVETDKTASAMRSLSGQYVTVELSQPMAAQTGHHHRPLVAWVTDISAVDDSTAEYGTAATAVRGFYYALADGNGDEAATFIVPERRKGPFAPNQMTLFYGNLVSPLQLLSIRPGSDGYLVRYQFTSQEGRCDGRAVVQTVMRNGINLISRIQALDGC